MTVAELQMLSLAMALIGFFIGSVVDRLRRASDELKQTLRLAAAGEMAGALAHELNQPLTALAATARPAKCCSNAASRAIGSMPPFAACWSSRRGPARWCAACAIFRTGATKLEAVACRTLSSTPRSITAARQASSASPSRSAPFPMSPACRPVATRSRAAQPAGQCLRCRGRRRLCAAYRQPAWRKPARQPRLPHRRG